MSSIILNKYIFVTTKNFPTSLSIYAFSGNKSIWSSFFTNSLGVS